MNDEVPVFEVAVNVELVPAHTVEALAEIVGVTAGLTVIVVVTESLHPEDVVVINL